MDLVRAKRKAKRSEAGEMSSKVTASDEEPPPLPSGKTERLPGYHSQATRTSTAILHRDTANAHIDRFRTPLIDKCDAPVAGNSRRKRSQIVRREGGELLGKCHSSEVGAVGTFERKYGLRTRSSPRKRTQLRIVFALFL